VAVAAIREAHVNIAIFPELALNPHLLTILRGELRKTNRSDSDLDWVVVGAYSQASSGARFDVYNSAHILGSDGKELRVQHKRHPYTMNVGEQRSYHLDAIFASAEEHDRDEEISIGDEAESPVAIVTDGRAVPYAAP